MIKEESHLDLEDSQEGTLFNMTNIKKEEDNMQDIHFVLVKSENQLSVDMLEEEPYSNTDSYPVPSLGLSDIQKEDSYVQDTFMEVKTEEQPSVDRLKIEPDLESYARSSSPTFCDVKREECTTQDVLMEAIEGENHKLISSNSNDETDENMFMKKTDLSRQNDNASLFICDLCKKTFNSRPNLYRHKCFRINRPFVCDICNVLFISKRNLEKHKHKKNHFVGEFGTPVFQCEFCPTTCKRKADIRTHIGKLHNKNKPVKCKRCDKSFPDRYTYKIHNKSHEGEKCFKCDLCPYASTSRRHMGSHRLVHTGQKPYQCNECDQSFRQKQLLRRHQNLHHNPNYVRPPRREKTHECPECEKAFRHMGNLMRHIVVHDPESSAQGKALGRQKNIQLSLKMVKEGTHLDMEDNHEGKLFNVCNIKKEGNTQDICFISVKSENELNVDLSHSNSGSYPVPSLGLSDIKKENSRVQDTFTEVKIEEQPSEAVLKVKPDLDGCANSSFPFCDVKKEECTTQNVTMETVEGQSCSDSSCGSGYISQCPSTMYLTPPTIYLTPSIPSVWVWSW